MEEADAKLIVVEADAIQLVEEANATQLVEEAKGKLDPVAPPPPPSASRSFIATFFWSFIVLLHQ
jgi:hypothetical protein